MPFAQVEGMCARYMSCKGLKKGEFIGRSFTVHKEKARKVVFEIHFPLTLNFMKNSTRKEYFFVILRYCLMAMCE